MINFAVANAKRCDCKDFWSDARVAEEARLESVYTPKAYPEFESRSLRKLPRKQTYFFRRDGRVVDCGGLENR